jgi:hypothetical protein
MRNGKVKKQTKLEKGKKIKQVTPVTKNKRTNHTRLIMRFVKLYSIINKNIFSKNQQASRWLED